MSVITTLLRFTGEVSGAVQSIDQLEEKMGGLGGAVASAGEKMEKVGGAMVKTGAALGFIAAPATLAFGEATKAASDFETGMAKIAGLTSSTTAEVETMRTSILHMTKEIPLSAKELADGMYFVASAGFKGAEGVEVLRVSAEAAAAGLGETKTVADAVTSALNAYQMGAEGAGRVTDILVNAVTQGKMPADALAGALGKVLPFASSLGVSLEEVTASIATMTRAGMSAAEASTAVRATLQDLTKISPKAGEAMRAIGTSADEVRQSIKEKGLLATLDMLMEKAHGDTEALTYLFPNIRALSGVLATAKAQPQAYAEILDSMGAATGRTDSAFKTMSGTAAFQGKMMENTFDDLKISIGNKLIPTLISLVQKIIPIVEKVTAWVEGNPELVTTILKVVGGMTVLLGALAGILIPLGMLIMSLGALMPIFSVIVGVLSAVAVAFGWPILVIIALVAAGVLIWKNWDKVVEIGQNLLQFLKDLAGKAVELMRKFQDFGPPFKLVVALFDWFTRKKQFNIAELLDILTDFMPPLKLFKTIWEWLSGNKSISFDMNAIQSLLNLPHLVWATFVKALDWNKFVRGVQWPDWAVSFWDWLTRFSIKITWPDWAVQLWNWLTRFSVKITWPDWAVSFWNWIRGFSSIQWPDWGSTFSGWINGLSRIQWPDWLVTFANWIKGFTSILWPDWGHVLDTWIRGFASIQWPDWLVAFANWIKGLQGILWPDWGRVLDTWIRGFASIQWPDWLVAFANWIKGLEVISWPDWDITFSDWINRLAKIQWPDWALTFAVWVSDLTGIVWPNWLSTFSGWLDGLSRIQWPDWLVTFANWVGSLSVISWPDWGQIFFGWLGNSPPKPQPAVTQPAPAMPGGLPPVYTPPAPVKKVAPSLDAIRGTFGGLYDGVTGWSSDVPQPAFDTWVGAGGDGGLYNFVLWLHDVGKMWAKGGIFHQATLGMVGEAGPEAVMPLTQFFDVMRQLSEAVKGLLAVSLASAISSVMPSSNFSIARELAAVGAGGNSTSYQLTANYQDHQSASSILADLQAMEMMARMRPGP